MAVIRVQVSTSITDREADYNKSVAETAALLRSKGLRNMVRVTHSGVPGIEVWSITLFEDWKEYGEKTDELNADPDMQKWYSQTILNRSGVLLDSFTAVEVPGFEQGTEPTGDVIAGTVWRTLPQAGAGGQFFKSCAASKEIHERYGAKARLLQVSGGRYAGLLMYTLGFENFTAMGTAQVEMAEEWAKFYSQQPVSATIENNIVLQPPMMT